MEETEPQHETKFNQHVAGAPAEDQRFQRLNSATPNRARRRRQPKDTAHPGCARGPLAQGSSDPSDAANDTMNEQAPSSMNAVGGT